MQWYKFSDQLPPYGEVVMARMKSTEYRPVFEAVVRVAPHPEEYKENEGYVSEDSYLMYSQEICDIDDADYEDREAMIAWISLPPIDGKKPYVKVTFEEGGNNVVGHYTTYDYLLYDKEMGEGK